VTDFSARPHRLTGDETAASNGRLHDDLLVPCQRGDGRVRLKASRPHGLDRDGGM